MTSAERAARLRLVQQDDEDELVRREEYAAAAARRVGDWRWRPLGESELQFRCRAIPPLQLDLTRSEARELLLALAKALGEKPPPVVKATPWMRLIDWLARRTWRKAHETEVRMALYEQAKEFREGGGW